MSSNEVTTGSQRPREEVKILFDHEIPTCPGKSIIGLHVDYTPGGWTPPHRHGGAFVVAITQMGEILSGMNGNPPNVYKVGESFKELPGCHHTVSDNNSKSEPARLMAILVVDTEVVKAGGYGALTVLDEGY